MSRIPPAFIGTVPEKYERYLGPYVFEPYAKDLVSRIHPGKVKTVLEIACGTGRVTGHLRKTLLPDTRLVATDLNADMLAIAQKKIPDQTIEWRVADVQDLPFDEHSFDLVICQFGLMFVPDKPRALAEIRRVLKPGGHLLLNTWDTLEHNPAFFVADKIVAKYFPADPPRFFHIPFSLHDKKELAALHEDAGFRDISVSLVSIDGTNASAGDIAAGMLEGTPVYPAIMNRNPALLPAIKKEVTIELARLFGESPMVSPLQAWVVEAHRK